MTFGQFFIVVLLLCSSCNGDLDNNIKTYYPEWNSLDGRPLPFWYDEAKVGIMLHWGVYSVPAMGEWFWAYWKDNTSYESNFMKQNYPPNFTYQGFGSQFTGEFFDPNQWAELFRNAGAKYVVITSKHHEGYCLWPSTFSFSWNSKDLGANRDLIGDLAHAIRNNTDLKFGIYYSLLEWFNGMYVRDKRGHFQSDAYVKCKMLPEMMELVETYKPEILWADGDWEASDDYFQSKDFLAWLYNDSPVKDTVVVNDRWGKGCPCHHGGYYTCQDRFNPGVLQHHKWESAMTLDKQSWGYRQNTALNDYLTIKELIVFLVRTVSCGGNILINVGPSKEGWIAPVFQDRLTNLGKWLSINGEAIYGSKPWLFQNDTIGDTWYTSKTKAIYAITLQWPQNNVLPLKVSKFFFDDAIPTVTLLGYPNHLEWEDDQDLIKIKLPNKMDVKSDWAWTIKIALD